MTPDRLEEIDEALAQEALRLALIPEGRAPEIMRALAQARREGWQEAIQSVRGSLVAYPDGGGDTEIMQEVERIRREGAEAERARAERIVREAFGDLWARPVYDGAEWALREILRRLKASE